MRAPHISATRHVNRSDTLAPAHNAAVERDDVSSASRVHNEMTHMRRARDAYDGPLQLLVMRLAPRGE
jgi:hypothetical protein